MLSRKGKYAIRALLFLARKAQTKPVLIQEISEEEGIPKKFLEAILLELKNEGILRSKKGKGGGYHLAQAPDTINLGRVIRLMDGPLAPIRCVSQTAYAPCEECHDERTCPIRLVMKEVRDAIATILDGTTLDEALKKAEAAAAQELIYQI